MPCILSECLMFLELGLELPKEPLCSCSGLTPGLEKGLGELLWVEFEYLRAALSRFCISGSG